MNGHGKSDRPIVPRNPPNNAVEPAAEAAEGRGRTKGNSRERTALRTQSRGGAPSALERVRQVARRDRQERFTALFHHVYAIDRLRAAYYALKREAAAGIDGETWRHYGEDLDTHLRDLAGRLQRGAYRAKPVRRAELKQELRRRRHTPVPEQGAYLQRVLRGYIQYHGVPGNTRILRAFRQAVGRLWWRTLRRRGQRHPLPRYRHDRYIERWFPPVRVCQPHPAVRLAVFTQGGSRMR